MASVFLALWLLLVPSAARADEPSIAVLEAGGAARGARRVVLRALDGWARIERASNARRVEDELGASIGNSRGCAAVAARLGAFVARIEPRPRHRARLVVCGPAGVVLERTVASPRARGAEESAALRLIDVLRDAMQHEGAPVVEEPPVEEPPVEEPPIESSDAPRVEIAPRPVEAPRHARGERDPESEAFERGDDLFEDTSPPRARPTLELLATLSFADRTMRVLRSDGSEDQLASGGSDELGVLARLRPLSHEALRGLAVDASASLSLAGTPMQGAMASTCRGQAGLSYEDAIGPVDLGGRVGFGVDDFEPSDARPAIRYLHLAFGATARVAVVSDALAVRGSLGLRSVLGNVQVDPRATQTASAFAIDGQLGVEGTVSFVHYELTGIYTRYAVDFGYPPRGVPGAVLVSGSDATLMVRAALGVAF